MSHISTMSVRDALAWIHCCSDVEQLRQVRDTDTRITVSRAAARRLLILGKAGIVFCVFYPTPSGEEIHERRADMIRAVLRVRQLTGCGLREAHDFVSGRESELPGHTALEKLKREGWDIRPVPVNTEGTTP